MMITSWFSLARCNQVESVPPFIGSEETVLSFNCLFLSFCVSFNGLSLVLKMRLSDLKKLKVCYNDSIRKLFRRERRSSISNFCVQHAIPTFAEVRRKAVVSLLQRLKSSNNIIIKSFVSVNSFYNSNIFSVWRPIAYT